MQQLKQKDLKALRIKLHKEQGSICPVLGCEMSIDEMVVDHQHRKKSDPIGENGGGLVRGCIHRDVNIIEGKIHNAFKRSALKDLTDVPTLLRKLADFLERDNLPYIHPSESPRPKKLKKQSYNALKRVYNGRAKFPPYPSSQRLTKPLERIYERFGIEPEFYK